jgi:hypothetical protein
MFTAKHDSARGFGATLPCELRWKTYFYYARRSQKSLPPTKSLRSSRTVSISGRSLNRGTRYCDLPVRILPFSNWVASNNPHQDLDRLIFQTDYAGCRDSLRRHTQRGHYANNSDRSGLVRTFRSRHPFRIPAWARGAFRLTPPVRAR